MKKAIFLTVGVSLLSTGAIAAGVFVPTVVNVEQFSFYRLNNLTNSQLLFNPSNLSNLNVNWKDVIIGSPKINNGTYVLYIGSQGIDTHNNFLYNQNYWPSDIPNQQFELLGNFGKAIEKINDLKVQPEVLFLQDQILTDDYNDYQAFEQLKKEYKNLDVSSSTDDSETFKNNKKKKEWAEKDIKFSLVPGAEYDDWEGNKQLFRKTNKMASFFGEIVNFVKSEYSDLKDITTSEGIIIGFKDGKRLKDYTGSFTPPSTDNPGTEDTPPTRSQFFSPFNSSSRLITPNDENTNPFLKWLVEGYEKK